MNFKIIAVKEEKILTKILKELEGYITISNNEIKHNLEGFTTYKEIKKGYTKILNTYFEEDKIFYMSAGSKNNIIDENESKYVKAKIEEKGFNQSGIIIVGDKQ